MAKFDFFWVIILSTVFPCSKGYSQADEKIDVNQTVRDGLEWLKRTQILDSNGKDPEGHWEAQGGQYPTSMTALAGMAFLMEGSTLRDGRYSEQLVRCVNWFMKRCNPKTGMIGNPNNPTEASRYMYGHGFGLLFLACVYGEEDRLGRRKDLERILTQGVMFCGNCQTDRGGWGYVSAKEGGNFDEGSVTITQLQALRAARNAGINVPKGIIDKAIKYLKDCTTPRGGIIYSLTHGVPTIGGERPPLTAAALACGISTGEFDSDHAKKWLEYCRDFIPIEATRVNHDEYQNYYFAQALWVLGDNQFEILFPRTKGKPDQQLRWSKYKQVMFPYIKSNQVAQGANKGSWNGSIGNVYSTSINLAILQLEKNILPIYQQ